MAGWELAPKLLVAFGVLLFVVVVVLGYGLLLTLLMRERRRRRMMQRRRARREMVSDEYAIVVPNQLFTAEIEVMAPEMVYLALDEDKVQGDEEDPASCVVDPEMDVSCAVCLEDIKDGDLIRSLPCNHEFHSSCITAWLRKCARCPLCNLSMERKKMVEM